ncbi:hypothetical protein BDV95DRAFT_590201 [Massariosphaeria phaeospora]|uniref:Uncharacterized protein n=1 Tax=Massariosphaeria phaeospora TaxID=100035 RepID=A0A7C8MIG7_9PLEO|nr:hypothetical protein BDV95DRAFT_590201 [Massariosphaeria phaeospora]
MAIQDDCLRLRKDTVCPDHGVRILETFGVALAIALCDGGAVSFACLLVKFASLLSLKKNEQKRPWRLFAREEEIANIGYGVGLDAFSEGGNSSDMFPLVKLTHGGFFSLAKQQLRVVIGQGMDAFHGCKAAMEESEEEESLCGAVYPSKLRITTSSYYVAVVVADFWVGGWMVDGGYEEYLQVAELPLLHFTSILLMIFKIEYYKNHGKSVDCVKEIVGVCYGADDGFEKVVMMVTMMIRTAPWRFCEFRKKKWFLAHVLEQDFCADFDNWLGRE